MRTYKRGETINYADALAILDAINPLYPALFRASKKEDEFNRSNQRSNEFVNTSLFWDDFPNIEWNRINREVEDSFRSWTFTMPETYEQRIARRLDYENSILNSQKVKEFNAEALRIAEKAKKKIDKKLQKFNEELLNGGVE